MNPIWKAFWKEYAKASIKEREEFWIKMYNKHPSLFNQSMIKAILKVGGGNE